MSVLCRFYTECLGMKLLRKRDIPEEKYTNAFLGYGPEDSHFVIELTYSTITNHMNSCSIYTHANWIMACELPITLLWWALHRNLLIIFVGLRCYLIYGMARLWSWQVWHWDWFWPFRHRGRRCKFLQRTLLVNCFWWCGWTIFNKLQRQALC